MTQPLVTDIKLFSNSFKTYHQVWKESDLCKTSSCLEVSPNLLFPKQEAVINILGHIILVESYLILSLKSTTELSNCQPKKHVLVFIIALVTQKVSYIWH